MTSTSGILCAEILFRWTPLHRTPLPLVRSWAAASRKWYVRPAISWSSAPCGLQTGSALDAAPSVATMLAAMPVAKLCLGGKPAADKADDLSSLARRSHRFNF